MSIIEGVRQLTIKDCLRWLLLKNIEEHGFFNKFNKQEFVCNYIIMRDDEDPYSKESIRIKCVHQDIIKKSIFGKRQKEESTSVRIYLHDEPLYFVVDDKFYFEVLNNIERQAEKEKEEFESAINNSLEKGC